MVVLPAGRFLMGGSEEDKFADASEFPRHEVLFARPFALGRCPVSAGEWQAFRGGSPAADPALPVARVSWQDAVDYTGWLSVQTGYRCRLATEAEWEYACRAGSESIFPSGSTITPADANYLYSEQGAKVGAGRVLPVGSFPANAFGLYDMAGNVSEWVADAWRPDYSDAPRDGSAWRADDPERRVVRGGAWDHLPRLLRSASRDWHWTDSRLDNLGFRVAADL